MEKFKMESIGVIQADDGGMRLVLKPEYIPALEGLKGFSHLSIIWCFSHSQLLGKGASYQIESPYQDGPQTLGIFATRSPVRPNPLALSCIEVIDIDYSGGVIDIAYTDAEDGTPLLDIKPYIPSLDRVEKPQVPGWCTHWPASVEKSGDFDWGSVFEQ